MVENQTRLENFGLSFSWSKYNQSQTKEKIMFLLLLKDLCYTLPPKMREKLFCMCVKTYSLKSSRRLIGELELCRRGNYITKVPHFNTLLLWFNSSDFTSELQSLITLTSLPLRAIERKFALDSTGFGMKILENRWSLAREKHSKHHLYKKAHILYGVLSNIVVDVKIKDGTSADSPFLPELVDTASKHFEVLEVSADKAYSSRKNLEHIFSKGALPFIPFKDNATEKKRGSLIWQQMYWFFKHNNKEFMDRYHLRSNAESGMYMIKSRFGDTVMTRSETAIVNELLCKILCHNLCVLIQEIFLSGIEVDFLKEND